MDTGTWWQRLGEKRYYAYCRQRLGYSPRQAQVSVAMAFARNGSALRSRLVAIRDRGLAH